VIRAAWVLGAVAIAGVYWLRLDNVAGLVVDDAWYIVLAQALASGSGYRLISSAADPILPAVPPGFAAVLAPLWLFQPQFPSNVMLLKTVSVAAMLGLAALTYAYIATVLRERGVALAAAIATLLLPSLVFLATSTVMPECLFAAVQLAAVFALDRPDREQQPLAVRRVVIAAVLTAFAVLLRAAGAALVVASILYLMHTRAWRRAALFAAVVGLCVLPWALYARANAPTAEQQRAHGGSMAYSYDQLLSMRQSGLANAGRAGLGDLPARVRINAADIFGRHVGAMILPAVYRGANESGLEVLAIGGTGARTGSMGVATGTIILSVLLSAVVLAGFISIVRRSGIHTASVLMVVTVAMVMLVPAHSSSFRYLVPLAPFFFLYFFCGVRAVVAMRRHVAGSPAAIRIAAVSIVLLFCFEHAQYVMQVRGGAEPVWLEDYSEVKEVATWMNRNLPGDGAVASTNPGLVYLLTGRRAVALDDPARNWDRWQQIGVRYAVAARVVERPPAYLGYRLLYESPGQKLWVLELAGGTEAVEKKWQRR
jgi:hypothetical protein